MSRIADELYFAPGIRFADLYLSGTYLPSQFQCRIEGFYLQPAIDLARSKHAFASGVLVVCAIDALGLLTTGSSSVTGRIKSLCRRISDLDSDEAAEIFCESFRNGLIHQARIKKGSEFSIDIDRLAEFDQGRLVVHPLFLTQAVSRLLKEYVRDLYNNRSAQLTFRNKLKRQFRFELHN
jgi:hypothetical protein